MTGKNKKESNDKKEVNGLDSFSNLMQGLLKKIGITTEEDAQAFISPDYESGTHDPFLLVDMDKAVDRVFEAIKKDQKIIVYSDFDADGIPGGVVLHDFFKKIGFENFENYIPHRHNEGYGLHKEALKKFTDEKVDLVITVDVGITAVDEAAYANELGLDVIITDHHELADKLPLALAVVNPKRKGYPDENICGAAVAFKLVQALLIRARKEDKKWVQDVPEGWEKWLLDLVGISTVADMVPLTGENRVLAYWGLQVLHKSRRVGLLALLRKQRIIQRNLNEDDIGFTIAPRINAASRMDSPEEAFRLFATTDIKEAEDLVRHLESLNNKRKGTVASMVREVRKRVEEREIDGPVIVLGDTEWKPSLLGLAANSLLGGSARTVCLWGREGNGVLKGSCRSDGSVPLVDMFKDADSALLHFGGHACAGGFAVSPEKIHEIQEVFSKSYEKLSNGESKTCEIGYDAGINLSDINNNTLKDINQLAPFGQGNEKPVFVLENVLLDEVKMFGKNKEHIDLMLSDGNGIRKRAIAFFSDEESFTRRPTAGESVTILANIESSTFAGRTELRMRLIDVR